jgi:DnaK suppressor protein
MPRDSDQSPAAIPAAGSGGPHWRAVLEARWQARLEELTELSLAYHGAAAPDGDGDGPGEEHAHALLCRAVAARRKLADVEEALGRLASGAFGRCEQCGSAIPAGLLAALPETRYCPGCDPEPARAHTAAGPSLR